MKHLLIITLSIFSLFTAQAQIDNYKSYKLFGRMSNSYNQLRINQDGFEISYTGLKNTIIVNGEEMWLEPMDGHRNIKKAIFDGNTYLLWIGDSSGGYEQFGYIAICYFKETKLIDEFCLWVDYMEKAKSVYRCGGR